MGFINSQEVSKQASRFVCEGGRLTPSVSGKVPRENKNGEIKGWNPPLSLSCTVPTSPSKLCPWCALQAQEVMAMG